MKASQPTLHSTKDHLLFLVLRWLFASVARRNMEAITRQVSAPRRRRGVGILKFLLTVTTFLVAGLRRGRARYRIVTSHFSESSTHPFVFTFSTGKWLDARFQPSHLLLCPPERERFQLVWGGVCRGFKERRWASVEHERQQFIILIAETWSGNSVEAGDGDVKPEPSASRKTLCFDLFFLINTGDELFFSSFLRIREIRNYRKIPVEKRPIF